jgi:hypothetical protein
MQPCSPVCEAHLDLSRSSFCFHTHLTNTTVNRTGGSFIEKSNKGHSPEPPTLVVKWMETLSRDVTWLRSDAFLKNHRSPDNLKRNCSKFSEATLFVSIPPYPCCNPALPVAAGARGDGVAKQIDLGPRWDPRPPPERSVACRHRAALRVVPEQQSIPSPPARLSSRCESAPCSRALCCADPSPRRCVCGGLS